MPKKNLVKSDDTDFKITVLLILEPLIQKTIEQNNLLN